ncbi:MAG: hypothetical protein FJ125_06545, partial [Deltaproteobacteria bacterium]|nr:hypothetical protein [Deltaproteobacteria bacterium]
MLGIFIATTTLLFVMVVAGCTDGLGSEESLSTQTANLDRVEGEARQGDRQPPDCALACQEEGRALMEECMSQEGAELRVCAARIRDVVRGCIAASCPPPEPPEPPEPPPCAQRCAEHGRELMERCMDREDADEQGCAARIHEAVRGCVEEHCPPPG